MGKNQQQCRANYKESRKYEKIRSVSVRVRFKEKDASVLALALTLTPALFQYPEPTKVATRWMQKPVVLTTFTRSDGHNFISLKINILTPAFHVQ
jgi:hypothetical protein